MGLRVANFIEEGRLGGPQIRIAEVAKHLNDIGIETTVILPKYQSEAFKQKLKEYNIKTVPLPIHRLTKDKKQRHRKEEVSDKEIQEQLRATLAKLSGSKTRGSVSRAKYRREKRTAAAEAEEEKLQKQQKDQRECLSCLTKCET